MTLALGSQWKAIDFFLMAREVEGLGELAAAAIADKWLVPYVLPHVVLHVVQFVSDLVAVEALKLLFDAT